MPIVTNGSNAAGSTGYQDSVNVQAGSGFAQFESPTGTIIGSFSGTRTFGPYNSQTFKVTSVIGSIYYEVSDNFPTGSVLPAIAVMGAAGIAGLQNPDGTTATLGGAGGVGGVSVALAATTLTLNSANTSTYNGNTIVATNASAQVITLAAGAALTGGFVVEQLGAGLVSIAASGVTLNAPNGLSTSGPRTTLVVIQEATDVYTVLAAPTADRTFVNATAGATPAVDMAKYNVVDLTLTANCTPAFSGSVSGQAFSVTLILRQDATGSRTLTLPTTKWSGGSAYATTGTASSIDVITLTTVDGGSTYLGFVGGKAFA